jgi:hypothetical protein
MPYCLLLRQLACSRDSKTHLQHSIGGPNVGAPRTSMKRARPISIRDRLQRHPNQWWRMEIQDSVGARSTQLVGTLSEEYDLQDIYHAGQAKKRLDLTPHGFFLQLAPGNRGHAKEFLGKFGPLKLTTGDRILGSGTHTIVDLD